MSDEPRDEPHDVEILSSERVYHGAVWDVRSEDFSYNGDRVTRQFVAHTGAAAVVAIDEGGRMLLLQQYRHPIRTRDWEIPAGLLDVEGEPPHLTARRELAEEADLVAARWEPLVSIYTTPGGNDEIVHIFLARELAASGETFAREHEEADITLSWLPLDEVVDGIMAGRLRNGILIAGALAAAERLRREGA